MTANAVLKEMWLNPFVAYVQLQQLPCCKLIIHNHLVKRWSIHLGGSTQKLLCVFQQSNHIAYTKQHYGIPPKEYCKFLSGIQPFHLEVNSVIITHMLWRNLLQKWWIRFPLYGLTLVLSSSLNCVYMVKASLVRWRGKSHSTYLTRQLHTDSTFSTHSTTETDPLKFFFFMSLRYMRLLGVRENEKIIEGTRNHS